MKSYILLSLLALSLCSISEPTCRIRQILDEFKQRLPDLEKEVYTEVTYPDLDIKGIVGKGFKYYSENTEIMKYEGVVPRNTRDGIVITGELINLLGPSLKNKTHTQIPDLCMGLF